MASVLTILVVDDERDIRDAVSEVLAGEGFVVYAAGDGAEALSKARTFHPALVLLDLMMPGMNGWEFCAVRRLDPELSRIPVVVVSALGRVAGIEAAGFIQKPFDVDELVSAVRQYATAAA